MMARMRGMPGHSDDDCGSGRGTLELIAFGVVAFSTILLIAASSVSFEGQTVQPMADGEAIPVHVVIPD